MTRRTELAAFLRSRRARIAPADVGLPPGPRRRTPGLRREELAQLAGVGVTWYTWLEQGRAINASTHVLDAIARTLRLDEAEHAHLYRLADVPAVNLDPPPVPLDPQFQVVLDGLATLPACVYNGRYDLVASNALYDRLFPDMVTAEGRGRNALWRLFETPPCCMPFRDLAGELPTMVATLRGYFVHHLGEPDWESFVRDLSSASARFAAMWASQDVAYPGPRTKVFRHAVLGDLRMLTSSLLLSGTPETRMVVFTPDDEHTRAALPRLGELPAESFRCPAHRTA